MKDYQTIIDFVYDFVKKNSRNNVNIYTLTKNDLQKIVLNEKILLESINEPIEAEHEHFFKSYETVINKLNKKYVYFEITEFSKNFKEKIENISLLEFDGKKFNTVENVGSKKTSASDDLLTPYKAITALNKYLPEILKKEDHKEFTL